MRRRRILRTDVGGTPHRDFLDAVALLGTEVLPRARAALASR
ncbi:hypothetical protein [Kitasatospora phosalacinea]|nr:hypothetical protein [Kitasatospora phosalacinea]